MKINEKTWTFIKKHADEDVRKVALLGTKDPEVDLKMALQQIDGRQTAHKKLPTWAEVEGIIYPPHLNMEQCSSEQTARYKARIAGKGESMVDLTGGFGVDFYWMSQDFSQCTYVEQNEQLCTIAQENFRVLGRDCKVVCGFAADVLQQLPHANLIFMDPARRNEHGRRTYGIADCTPNVLELLPLLMQKADRLLLKLSPMLDWRKAVDDINRHGGHVNEVHIVSVDNECKELVIQMRKDAVDALQVVCVNLLSNGEQQIFETLGEQSQCITQTVGSPCQPNSHFSILNSQFLYEPNASIMKAGCFAELEQHYPIRQVAHNSHLFLSTNNVEGFPGRKFEIQAITSMNKKDINQKLTSVESANIAVRNFPMSTDQLRKKLKLKDGGDTYIFATTLSDGEHKLFICRKIG